MRRRRSRMKVKKKERGEWKKAIKKKGEVIESEKEEEKQEREGEEINWESKGWLER